MDIEIIVIAHNLRSCENVGSILRTADGLGVSKVIFTGYTPYPIAKDDARLQYLREKISKRINKSSLGAENFVKWEHHENIEILLHNLKKQDFQLVGLEQTSKSINLEKFNSKDKVALLLGREVEGIEQEIIDLLDEVVAIPMLGKKESFNVAQAAAMALYKLRYFS